MASSPHETMLREITVAGDRERTGALDVEWEGAHASLFFLFGHPSHVVFETPEGKTLVGDDALTSLVAELPEDFRVAPWRRAMVPDDTIRLTAEDLLARFTNPPQAAADDEAAVAAPDDAGATADAPAAEDAPSADTASVAGDPETAGVEVAHEEADAAEATPGVEESPDPAGTASEEPAATDEPALGADDAPADDAPAGAETVPSDAEDAADAGESAQANVEQAAPPLTLASFPALTVGPLLFSDAVANVTHREAVFPLLPDCVMVLTAHDHHAAAIVHRRQLVDAAWLTADGGMVGEDALTPLMTTEDGHLTAYSLEDDRLVTALPLLWRGPRHVQHLPGSWVDAEVLAQEIAASRRTCAVIVTGARSGAALFHEGALLGVFVSDDTAASPEAASLDELLAQPGAEVAVAGTLEEPAAPFQRRPRRIPGGDADSNGGPGSVLTIEALPEAANDVAGGAVRDPEEIPDHVPTRLPVDMESLRSELTAIATRWLGDDDAAPVAAVLSAAPPGVANVVAAIAGVGRMEVPGREPAVVRAMAREMHFRAAEVLCGV